MGLESVRGKGKDVVTSLTLGQEFMPFSGIRDLNTLVPGETLDVIGRSAPFYLEGIGKGEFKLMTIEPLQGMQKGTRLLDLSGEKASIVLTDRGLARVEIDIYLDDKNSPPDINCVLSVKGLELIGEYVVDNPSNPEGYIFFMGFGPSKNDLSDIVIPVTPDSLAQLSFRFDPKTKV